MNYANGSDGLIVVHAIQASDFKTRKTGVTLDAEIIRESDGDYYNGSTWQAGVTTVSLSEVGSTGIYSLTVPSQNNDIVHYSVTTPDVCLVAKTWVGVMSWEDLALTSGISTEVASALNTYDPPTKAELDAGLGALNDLSSSDIDSALTTYAVAKVSDIVTETTSALNAYDPPTKAELDAGLAAIPASLTYSEVESACASAVVSNTTGITASEVWDHLIYSNTTYGGAGEALNAVYHYTTAKMSKDSAAGKYWLYGRDKTTLYKEGIINSALREED